MGISENIDENITKTEEIFKDCADVVKKKFHIPGRKPESYIYILYIDGLCDNEMIEDRIIKPVTYYWQQQTRGSLWEAMEEFEIQTADISQEYDFEKVINSVMKGDTGIFVSGSRRAFVMSSKALPVRSIDESSTEGGMRGARDSFNESLRTTTALIRRRIRDTGLKVVQSSIGTRSKTDYALLYIKDLAQPELVEQVEERINKYEIDAVFDSGMAEHLMEGKWYRPFPVFQATTRPDKAAAAIVEGRVVIAFDNSPEVLIAPATINTLFQTADDYYNRWPVASFARIIRYVAAFIAAFMPGFYIAITCFHREVIPEKLLYAIAAARSQLSFPIVVEVLIMELLFELLREAGIRLPGQLGNTIGVVGGLIVGQAAVEAGIVSTIVIIVVALTAIASFAIPNEVFASVFRLLKFVTIFTSAVWGLYGFFVSVLILLIWLSQMESFGVPYMSPLVHFSSHISYEERDFILRAPISSLKYRPFWAKSQNSHRLKRR